MTLDMIMQKLSQLNLFAGISKEALRLMAFSAERKSLHAGDILVSRGDSSDGAYFILSGSIALQTRDDGGPSEQIIGENCLIGETALIIPTDNPASAIARQPCVVLFIPRSLFLRLLNEFPDVAIKLRENFARRLSDFSAVSY
jgi:CRP-like cAMP-binding protein